MLEHECNLTFCLLRLHVFSVKQVKSQEEEHAKGRGSGLIYMVSVSSRQDDGGSLFSAHLEEPAPQKRKQ